MFKRQKIMFVGVLWVGACVFGAQQSIVPGFTSEEIQFIEDAYSLYQESIKHASKADQREVEIQYCNTVLSRFYRSELNAMYKAVPRQSLIKFKEGIQVACKNIDKIAHGFNDVFRSKNIQKIQSQINQWKEANTLQIVLNAVNNHGITFLISACDLGNIIIVKDLFSFKRAGTNDFLMDVNFANNHGNTALMWACLSNRTEVVKFLLSLQDSQGNWLVDVNAQDNFRRNVLWYACQHKDLKIVRMLLERGANILKADRHGQSPLSLLHIRLQNVTTSDADKSIISSILNVFDALKPGLDVSNMSREAQDMKSAYVMMQQGSTDEMLQCLVTDEIKGFYYLRQEALLVSEIYHHQLFARVEVMKKIFKYESIVPILRFLNTEVLHTIDRIILQAYVDVLEAQQHEARRSVVMLSPTASLRAQDIDFASVD